MGHDDRTTRRVHDSSAMMTHVRRPATHGLGIALANVV
jgi:hypothetical protein